LDEGLLHAADGLEVLGDAVAVRGVRFVLFARCDVDAAGEAVAKGVECTRIAFFRNEFLSFLNGYDLFLFHKSLPISNLQRRLPETGWGFGEEGVNRGNIVAIFF